MARFMLLRVLVACFGLAWMKLILAAVWLLAVYLLVAVVEAIAGTVRVVRAHRLTVGAYRRAKSGKEVVATDLLAKFEPVAALVPWRGLPPTHLLVRVLTGLGAVACWALGAALGAGVEAPSSVVLGVEWVCAGGALAAIAVAWWRADRAVRVCGARWREVLMRAQSRGWTLMAAVGSVLTLGLVLWSAVLLAAVGSPWQFGANPSYADAAIRAEAIGNLGLLGWWLSFAFLNFLGNRREI